MTEFTPLENLTYEQALAEMESIVTALESEKRSLDEAMALYERGQLLARYLSDLLDQAELKIQQLAGDRLTDFTPPE